MGITKSSLSFRESKIPKKKTKDSAGDRNNPVEYKKRKDIKGIIAWRKNIGPKDVELHKSRPDVLGMRRKFDYETFVPALRGQKFIRGRPLIRDVRDVGLIEGDVPLEDE